jgi:hypothetical protein
MNRRQEALRGRRNPPVGVSRDWLRRCRKQTSADAPGAVAPPLRRPSELCLNNRNRDLSLKFRGSHRSPAENRLGVGIHPINIWERVHIPQKKRKFHGIHPILYPRLRLYSAQIYSSSSFSRMCHSERRIRPCRVLASLAVSWARPRIRRIMSRVFARLKSGCSILSR